jgi:dephospho-CoA kinase
MTRVLITGMSGTGKSTVIAELAARGYRAVDLDSPEWSYTRDDGEWVWREDRVERLLADDDGDPPRFVSGCSINMVRFYPRFDEIVLLSAPTDVMLERIATRTTNLFGKTDAEREKILRDTAEVEPLLRRVATREIVTTGTVDEVAARILRVSDVADV